MPNSMDYFDTIMTYLLSAQFSFYLCDKFNVVSKVHYKSILFLEFIHILKYVFIKSYCNMDNLKFHNVNVEYDFTF